MANWYCTRDDLKTAFQMPTDVRDDAFDIAAESGSRSVDGLLGRRDGAFLPQTQTRRYPWPQNERAEPYRLWLDEWLLSLTGLTAASGAVTVPLGDVFLEPSNEGPPYTWLEVDRASSDASAAFSAGDTHQRAIAATGLWGFAVDTVAAGTITSELDASQTSVPVSDGELVEVGHTLLIDDEQLFVTEKVPAQSASVTVERGVNGTTPATHSSGTAILRYRVPADVRQLAIAEALNSNSRFLAGYQGSVEPPLNSSSRRGDALQQLRDAVRLNPRYAFPVVA